MSNLTPQVLADLWRSYRSDQTPEDPALASFQKFMVLHEDMHAVWDKLVADPATPIEVEGENLLLHIAMDTATEGALGTDRPPGVRALFTELVGDGFDQGQAFHVLSQAMQHEFLTAAQQGKEMDPADFLRRATDYGRQAREQRGQAG